MFYKIASTKRNTLNKFEKNAKFSRLVEAQDFCDLVQEKYPFDTIEIVKQYKDVYYKGFKIEGVEFGYYGCDSFGNDIKYHVRCGDMEDPRGLYGYWYAEDYCTSLEAAKKFVDWYLEETN